MLQIHTKKRNILDVNRLNSLVYVHFNARLFDKQKKIREGNVDVILDSVFKPGPNRRSDRIEPWTENNPGWVKAKTQLKSNHLKIPIEPSKTREPATQWTGQSLVRI